MDSRDVLGRHFVDGGVHIDDGNVLSARSSRVASDGRRSGRERADWHTRQMYTQSLGPWARSLFVIGAIVSSVFYAVQRAGCVDAFVFRCIRPYRITGLRQYAIATKVHRCLCVGDSRSLGDVVSVMKDPPLMVILGGIATVVILVIVVFAAIQFRKESLPAGLLPGTAYSVAFWVSVISIALVAALSTYKTIGKMIG